MKLFIKRDISDTDSAFTVFDELGCEKYYAVFTKAKSRNNLVLTDTQNNVVAAIRRLPFVGAKSFVLKAGKAHLTFVIVITSKGVYCNFYGNNWHINGDIASKNFSIFDVDNSVISTHKNCINSSEINIFDKSNELFCIATSICLSLINTVDKLAIQAV